MGGNVAGVGKIDNAFSSL